LFVTVGVLAQIFWFLALEEVAPGDGGPINPHPTPLRIVATVGSALLVCAVLLYVPEGIRRARSAYRENQAFKDRFR